MGRITFMCKCKTFSISVAAALQETLCHYFHTANMYVTIG